MKRASVRRPSTARGRQPTPRERLPEPAPKPESYIREEDGAVMVPIGDHRFANAAVIARIGNVEARDG